MKKIGYITVIALCLAMGNAHGTSLDISGWTDIAIANNTGAQPSPGIFLKGNQLALVGAYATHNGSGMDDGFTPGDIFISRDRYFKTDGLSGDTTVTGNMGFEYVLDLQYQDWTDPSTYTFDGVKLFGTPFKRVTPTLMTTSEGGDSSPWAYVSGGRVLNSGNAVSYYDSISGQAADSDGRYALVMDLGAIGFVSSVSPNLYAHFTLKNGSDKLLGFQTSTLALPPPLPTPEPATLLLTGFGLIGIAGLARRRVAKS